MRVVGVKISCIYKELGGNKSMKVYRYIRGILKYIFDPSYRFLFDASRGKYNKLSDEIYLMKMFKAKTGRELKLNAPVSFNEKLQWLKLYDRKPEYITMVDKYKVREYISQKIGNEYLVPLLGVWDDPEDIDFDSLPDKFVLKCNHNSGLGMCICKNKKELNIKKVKKGLAEGLKENHFYAQREWPYKNVKPKIIAEKYLENTEFDGLIDYKFYCFDGEPKFLYVGFARIVNGIKYDEMTYLTLDWKPTPFSRPDHKELLKIPEKPACLDEILNIAQKLSTGIPFVRVDLFLVNDKIYFSELTFYPGGGLGLFMPEEWEQKIGNWINLQ